MADPTFLSHLQEETRALHESGLYKAERILASPQAASIRVEGGPEVINFCANNYLGLSNHPALIEAARDALPRLG
ncbi:MAG: glycine C-acetyltransferase, partial [Myxococcales bacterium]|nr:glycine C-acetyltransferase [Myxococcales bacterium]